MKYQAEIYKNHLYIKPKPKEDIKGGLVVILNKPPDKNSNPMMYADVVKNRKKYDLPKLPEGVWVTAAFVKE